MSKRTDRMYKNSPHMERDDESGKMNVKKPEKGEMQHSRESGTPGGTMEEGLPPVIRHSMERRDMHSRHEMEHVAHDHGKGGPKHEMHDRHEKEMKDMHKRHEKEQGAPAGEKEHKPKEKEGGEETPKEKKTEEEKG